MTRIPNSWTLLGLRALLVSSALPCGTGAQVPNDDVIEIEASVILYVIANNHSHALEGPNRAICVGLGGPFDATDPYPELMRRFAAIDTLPVLPRSSCAFDEQRQFRGNRRPRLVVQQSGEPAIAVAAYAVEPPTSDSVRVSAGYYEDVLSSATYSCLVERRPSGWEVVGCDLREISQQRVPTPDNA